jgi:dihydrofolate reductase
MAYSIDEALKIAGNSRECFVIGGGIVYKQMMPIAGKLYLTRVHKTFEADTFFPEIDFTEWEEKETEKVQATEKNDFSHTYSLYIRK